MRAGRGGGVKQSKLKGKMNSGGGGGGGGCLSPVDGDGGGTSAVAALYRNIQ